MKNSSIKIFLSAIMLFSLSFIVESADSLKYCISFNYYKDLSDTYDGGSLFSGDLKISKLWYGASISFGYFQSHSVFQYQVFVEEINKSLTIPFDELTGMKTGSLSLMIIPVKSKYISADILFGLVICKAKSLQFHDLEYSYSFQDNKFNYLYKNYELVKNAHFGYQVGFNVSFSITKKFGLQIKSRIQDLSNGGTFFFVGGGLCFKL